MDEKLRQASGSTATTNSTITSVSGTGTTESAEVVCGCPQPSMEKIEVEQVLAAEMSQRVVEFDMIVPEQKPDIEQIIDVYVKNVEIKHVKVIPDKVIIRGELETKVMYVADLPNQPVHAFEKFHVRFTRDVPVPGAEPDMKATADVTVEYVDYDFERRHDRRKVHITIVLKFWVRVVSTTEMDVYALGPIDQVGEVESTTAEKVSASQFVSDKVSASQTAGGQYAGYGAENVIVTGPGVTPTAGTAVSVSGTVTVTGSVVNLRTGPGTNYPVVTKVNKGATLTVQDQAFGWYQVTTSNGTVGWIASWLVSGGTMPVTPKG